MKFYKFCSSVSLALILLFFSNQIAQGATISLLSWDLVDAGKHLDWGGTTARPTLFNNSVNTWNGYKAGIIRPDSIGVIQDLGIMDINVQSDYAGITYPGGTMYFNTFFLDNYTIFEQQNVYLHEMGHALGLEHNMSNDAMYKYVTSKTTLSDNDKASYDAAYKRY